MKAQKSKPKARKRGRPRLTPSPMPKSIVDEVKRIRNDFSELEQEFLALEAKATESRGVDISYSVTDHATACSICGEVGSHPCLPILHQLIEDNDTFRDTVWKVFQEMDKKGFFKEETEVSKEINLGVW